MFDQGRLEALEFCRTSPSAVTLCVWPSGASEHDRVRRWISETCGAAILFEVRTSRRAHYARFSRRPRSQLRRARCAHACGCDAWWQGTLEITPAAAPLIMLALYDGEDWLRCATVSAWYDVLWSAKVCCAVRPRPWRMFPPHVMDPRMARMAWHGMAWCGMPCHAVSCHAVRCHAVPCHAVLYNSMPCRAVESRGVLCHTVACYAIRAVQCTARSFCEAWRVGIG